MAPLPVLLNGASGALLILLGLGVLLVRPRRRANVALAAYSMGFGGIFLFNNVGIALAPTTDARIWSYLSFASAMVGFTGLVATMLRFPEPLGARWRRQAPLLAGALACYVLVALAHVRTGGAYVLRSEVGPAFALVYTALVTSLGTLLGTLAVVVFSIRFEAARARGESGRNEALVAAAIGSYYVVLLIDTATELPTNDVWGVVRGLGALGQVGIMVAAWLPLTARHASYPRNVVLLFCALGVASLLLPNTLTGVSPLSGVTRTLSVALLAYAILRGQLLGLDARVRFAISKSTLGAFFVAAFFLVSAIGQRWFEASLGPALGIVAAACLVFAIAPLQRLADRLAGAAVPMTAVPVADATAPPPEEHARRERVYRRAYLAAVADGALTRAEEEHLAHIAHDLGLGHLETLKLRREVDEA